MVTSQTFWLSLAMAKSVGELQALSPHVAFKGPVLSQLCLPALSFRHSPGVSLPCLFLTVFEGVEIAVSC